MTHEEIIADIRFKNLRNLNDKIYDVKLDILNFQTTYELLKKEQELKRQKIMAEISSEKSDDGKKKFNNEDQRQTEFQKRLENDEIYHKNEKSLQDLHINIQKNSISMLHLSGEMENYSFFIK